MRVARPKLNCPECWRPLVRAPDIDAFVCRKRYARCRPGPTEGSCVLVGEKIPCEDVVISALSLIEPGPARPPREPIEDRWYDVPVGRVG